MSYRRPVRLPSQVHPPRIALRDGPLVAPGAGGSAAAPVLALPVLPAGDGEGGVSLGPGAADVLDHLEAHGRSAEEVFAVLEQARAAGRAGEVTALPVPTDDVELLLLVGVGDAGPDDLRRAGAAIARRCHDLEAVATSVAALADPAGFRAFVEGLVLGSFGFHWRSEGPRRVPVARVVLTGLGPGTEHADLLDRATAVAGAGWAARTLAFVPSQLKNPAWLADQAATFAERSGLELEVWDEHRLAAEGFGGIVGVGQASATPPRLIRLSYTPRGISRSRAKKLPHVVLVGKGITFDTGGLSIKPAEAMATMKRDMTGGGVVLAVMDALEALDVRVRVTGLVPAAENAISGSALRPGDVIRHYGGRTSEVTNTDAEGRLVMADALAYAVDKLDPSVLVDVATLTGAVKVALGLRTGGIFADDDILAEHLRDAGRRAGEPLWRLPLADEYLDLLDSDVADADNAAGGPGAITAALFLRPFTADVPWAHLDIASVGDSPADSYEWSAGPTGFGARLLLHWLEQHEPLAGVGSAS